MQTNSLNHDRVELAEVELRQCQAFTAPQLEHKFHDLAISELSPQRKLNLERPRQQNQSWFSTLGFAEFYCFPPAERVCFFEHPSGEVSERCFYRVTKWCGLVTKIEVLTRINQESDLIRVLKATHGPSIVELHWLDESTLSNSKTTWGSARIERTREDCWLKLPATTSEYLKSLGAKTRKHLPYYVRRLQREWGQSWRFESKRNDDILWQDYDRLLELNRLRMVEKGRASGWKPQLREHRWKLTMEHGLLCCLVHEGQIVAGTLSFVHANEAYLSVIAHDPRFDKQNLGSTSLWLTVNHLIEIGCSRFHLLWGQSFYKEQFGGKENPLYKVALFDDAFIAAVWHFVNWISSPMRIFRKVRNRLFGYWLKQLKWVSAIS